MARMVTIKKCTFGYTEERGTIRFAAQYDWSFFEGRHMLIAALDSTVDLRKLKRWQSYLQECQYEWKTHTSGVIIAAPFVKRIFEDGRTFSHYDEIFLFESEPPSLRPRKYPFTPEWMCFEEKIPPELTALAESSAFRYLSDGSGLNFVCESELVANQLVANLSRDL